MWATEIKMATISCEDLDASAAFWCDVMQYREKWRTVVGGPEFEKAWGLPAGTEARVAFLNYEDIPSGQVRLVEFSPRGEEYVRTTTDNPWDIGIGALDVNVRDPEEALNLLRDAGCVSKSAEPVYYEIAGHKQAEVVCHGPDGVNILLICAENYEPHMARAEMEGDFGPVTVVSQFVNDMDESARFYGEGLGLACAFDTWTDEESRAQVNRMVGIPEDTPMRLAVYQMPGNPDGKHLLLQTKEVERRFIAHRMTPPNLGVVMISHFTEDLDRLYARLPQFGADPLNEPVTIRFGDQAVYRCFHVRAPGGILLEFIGDN